MSKIEEKAKIKMYNEINKFENILEVKSKVIELYSINV